MTERALDQLKRGQRTWEAELDSEEEKRALIDAALLSGELDIELSSGWGARWGALSQALVKYASQPDDVVRFVGRHVAKDPLSFESYGVAGWAENNQEMLGWAAEKGGDTLLGLEGDVPEAVLRFIELLLYRRGDVTELSDEAAIMLAQSWLADRAPQRLALWRKLGAERWNGAIAAAVSRPETRITKIETFKKQFLEAEPSLRLRALRQLEPSWWGKDSLASLARACAKGLDASHLPLFEEVLTTMGKTWPGPSVSKIEGGVRVRVADPGYPDFVRWGTGACGVVLAWAECLERSGEMELPLLVDDILFEGLSGPSWDSNDAYLKILERLPEERRQALLLRSLDCARFEAPAAAGLLPSLPTPAMLEIFLKHIEDRVPKKHYRRAELGKVLASFGEVFIDRAERRFNEPKLAAHHAEILLLGLEQLGAAGARALTPAMGLGSKAMRDLASRLISNAGEAGKAALLAGLKHKKKKVRQECEALLQRIYPDAVAPSSDESTVDAEEKKPAQPTIPADAAALLKARDEASAQTRKTIEEGFLSDKTGVWSIQWGDVLQEYGPLAMAIVAEKHDLSERDERQAVSVRRLVDAKNTDGLAWVVVHALPKEDIPKFRYRRIRTIMAPLGASIIPAAVDLLMHEAPRPPRQIVFDLVAENATEEALELLVFGLEDAKAPVRKFSVQGLLKLGPKAAPAVVEKLRARKKPIRIAAAEILAATATAGEREAIESALKKEKAQDVRGLLETALARSESFAAEAGPDGAAGGGVPKVGGVEDITEFLASPKGRLPKWISLAALPRVKTSSGDTLSEKELRGLILRASREGSAGREPRFWRLHESLDSVSATELARAVLADWRTAGEQSKFKWALSLYAALADDDALDTIGLDLDELAGRGRHHQAKWWLEAFASRGGTRGLGWIAFWARNGLRPTVKNLSRELLEEAANDAGDVNLRASLDPFIDQDAGDRVVPDLWPESDEQRRALLEKESQRLERAMIEGRSWSAAQLRGVVFQRAPLRQMLGTLVLKLHDVEEREAARLRDRDGNIVPLRVLTPTTRFVRLFDDGLAIETGEVIALGDDRLLTIAHPVEMSGDERATWAQVLASEGAIPVFQQLNRPLFEAGGELPKIVNTLRWKPGAFAQALRVEGWRRGHVEDAGMIYSAFFQLAGRGTRVWLSHSGYPVSGADGWRTPVVVDDLWFTNLDDSRRVDPDAVTFSEGWLALARVAESAD